MESLGFKIILNKGEVMTVALLGIKAFIDPQSIASIEGVREVNSFKSLLKWQAE
ncbi:MAG: hypothetical protein MZV70_76360 [Desulfobacterales bacterium]|nr:hypothetical protein [Desulfobacterales bacterium]